MEYEKTHQTTDPLSPNAPGPVSDLCPHRGSRIANKLGAVAIQELAPLAQTSVPAQPDQPN